MKFNATSLISIAVIAAAASAAPAFARDAAVSTAKQTIALKDNETLYVFANGKMAKENKYGQAAYLKPDSVLETTDGKKITPVGNEVALLTQLLRTNHSH